MHPDRWQRVETLFGLAMDTAPEDRQRVLENACTDDSTLVIDVLGLIDNALQHPEFLEHSLIDASLIPPVRDSLATGETLSATSASYRVVERIGAGGMADVFRGVRTTDALEQPVAIKVMRRGIDSDVMVRRFRLEARILASLSHPNIARFLDAGAASDGRPFVVLQYIDGVSLVAWCDQHKLTIDARLQLLIRVCAAVQHAHQHFVVHRDIKPSNVMVTADGEPMLLDFGIGKIMRDAELDFGSRVETTHGERVMTPDYAAPEQLTGDAVSTATDVYALGLLMCELLTGALPWPTRARSSEERERSLRTEDPQRPSQLVTDANAVLRGVGARELARNLEGDLDTIVMAAIRREPARRYPTAVALADDLQRYLDGRPVLARVDALGYRVQKFVRRHAVAVSSGVVALLAIVLTMALLVRNDRALTAAAKRVTIERDRAREVRTFLLETFGASGADRTISDTVSVRRLLDLQAAQVATRYRTQPDLQSDMLEALAEAYDRLGLATTAEPLAARAVQLRRAAAPRAESTLRDALPASVSLHGWLLHASGHSKDAEPLLKEAIAARRTDADAVVGLSRSLNDLGVVYNATARYPDAETVLTEALQLRETTLGANDRAVGITANNLAATYFYLGRHADAAAMQARALQSLTASYGLDHQRTIVALANLATFRRQAGDRAGAERDYRDLLARQTRLQGATHPVTARVMTSLAQVRVDAASRTDPTPLAEAEDLVRRALSAYTTSLGPAHPDVGKASHQLATILLARGQLREATRHEAVAAEILTRTLGPQHPSTLATRLGQARIDSAARRLGSK